MVTLLVPNPQCSCINEFIHWWVEGTWQVHWILPECSLLYIGHYCLPDEEIKVKRRKCICQGCTFTCWKGWGSLSSVSSTLPAVCFSSWPCLGTCFSPPNLDRHLPCSSVLWWACAGAPPPRWCCRSTDREPGEPCPNVASNLGSVFTTFSLIHHEKQKCLQAKREIKKNW